MLRRAFQFKSQPPTEGALKAPSCASMDLLWQGPRMRTTTYLAQTTANDHTTAPQDRQEEGAEADPFSGITLDEAPVTMAITADPFLFSFTPQAFQDKFLQSAQDYAAPYATTWEMTHNLQLREEEDTIHISCMMHAGMQQAKKAFFENSGTQPREGDTALYVHTFDPNRRVIIFTFKAFTHSQLDVD